MKDFLLLTDLEQVRSLAHEHRLAILRVLGTRAMSGSQVARELDLPPGRVQYHLRHLSEHGLVEQTGTGRRRWKEERFFAATAHHFVVDPELGVRDPATSQRLARTFEQVFDEWRRSRVLEVDLALVARRVVQDCLRVAGGETVLVMFGPHGLEIAEAMLVEIEAMGARGLPKVWSRNLLFRTLDRHDEASLARLPFMDARDLEALDAGVFVNSTMPQGGPPDERQRSLLPHRMEAVSRWQRALLERSVRYVEISLPHRGEVESGDLSAEESMEVFWSSLTTDYQELARRTSHLVDLAAGAREWRVTCPRGTDLVLEIDPERRHVSDGVVDDADRAAGQTFEELPAGSVAWMPVAARARGTVVSDYTFTGGQPYRDVRFEVEAGRLVRLREGRGGDSLAQRMEQAVGDVDLLGLLRIGVNPAPGGLTGKPGLDTCRAGTVTIGFGTNELLGGSGRATLDLRFLLRDATVRAGERLLVRDGELLGRED